ncbi:lipase family protein [Gordonia sp. N1V]|uniref:lipase family protein n=1 Tax=Gordonia sp. N1V TaxID=3034163 RepID=UPI0023E1E0A8|nr:lipase family protein [Gordonia sp. N1V]MDF3285066.1 lipase family protein [Gordonia sp. N1V]
MRRRGLVLGALLIGVVALLWSPLPGSPTAQAAPSLTSKAGAGTVISSTDITDQKDARMTGARQVIAMTYLSENAQGELIPVRGTVSIPEKNPHGGDYRIFAWAHGTAGLGDGCTVTDRMGVRVDGKERWHDWMGPWLDDGYVITATEYAGVGGPGVHPYADGEMQGKNVIDSVRAARTVVAQYSDTRAGTDYLTSGGSQGGQSAVWAGHLAPTYAPELHNVGVAASSVPVDTSQLLKVVAPGVPPVSIPDYVTYVSYVLAGVKAARPDVDVDSYLTPLGKELVEDAATQCYPEFSPSTRQYNVGQMVTKPLAEGPLIGVVHELSAVPDAGYRAPMLIQQGTLDVVAPAPLTSAWVDRARASGARIDYQTYNDQHGLGAYSETAALRWADTLQWAR